MEVNSNRFNLIEATLNVGRTSFNISKSEKGYQIFVTKVLTRAIHAGLFFCCHQFGIALFPTTASFGIGAGLVPSLFARFT